jgi:hypothetical protein
VNEQYFIRVRGRVQGPFDADKLRQLARRGQFSRLHEISTDSQQWSPAKNYPDLFAAPAGDSVAPSSAAGNGAATAELPRGNASVAMSPAALPPGGAGRQDVWYYAFGGNPTGPVDFLRLSSMIASAQIGADTSVWREGMADWVPAHTIPGLVAAASSRNESRSDSEVSTRTADVGNEIGSSIVRVLEDSRPWIMFLAICIFLNAAAMLVGGIFQLTFGARTTFMPLTAAGLTNMIGSIVVGFGGYFLISFANGIARFERSRREEALGVALNSLKAFWIYVSMVLIVMIALGVIAAIIVFATIGSIPDFR